MLIPVNNSIDLNIGTDGNQDHWVLRQEPAHGVAESLSCQNLTLVMLTCQGAPRLCQRRILQWYKQHLQMDTRQIWLFPAGTFPAELGDEEQPTCCSILPITPTPPPKHLAMRKEKITAPSKEVGTCYGDLCQKHWSQCKPKSLNVTIKVTE